MAKYNYKYDTGTGEVLSVEMIDTVGSDDDAVYQDFVQNRQYYYVVGGVLTKLSEAELPVVSVEENIVPLGETCGVSKDSAEGLAAVAEYEAAAAAETVAEEIAIFKVG